MILARLFEDQSMGFYIDVGAHHPTRFSNTQYFYSRGWKGLNIDAAPGSMAAFDVARPRDINLEAAVAEKTEKFPFYVFDEPALSTFDAKLARERDGAKGHRIIEVKEIETQPLSQILENNLSPGQQIDFLSIDVEGLDLSVLRSNDWNRFTPKCVLTEDFSGQNIDDVIRGPICSFLKSIGYSFFAKTAHTQFYRKSL